jgi:hypothetical protein
MGLDQFAYAVKPEHVGTKSQVDFDLPEELELLELSYWRKHPNLHGWMENLYRDKGGSAEQFNCVKVVLNADDLDKLEDAVRDDELPETDGFFFGKSSPDDKRKDLDFIKSARNHLAEGFIVYYTSWW